jgi:hypothetical protein
LRRWLLTAESWAALTAARAHTATGELALAKTGLTAARVGKVDPEHDATPEEQRCGENDASDDEPGSARAWGS